MATPPSPKSHPIGVPEGSEASPELIAAEDDLSLAGPSTIAQVSESENWVTILFTHNGKEHSVSLADSDR